MAVKRGTGVQDLGASLTAWKQARGVSNYDIAEKAGLSQPTVSRILNGHQWPGQGALEGICRVLGVRLRLEASK